jgi:GNAT superfamily N-acetyltransferase
MATADDAGRLAALMSELIEEVLARRGGKLLLGDDGVGPEREPVATQVDDVLADPVRLALVGTIDKVVIAFALCHYEDVGVPGRRGILDACYVEPGARGVGVGRLLLDTALTWLADRRCRGGGRSGPAGRPRGEELLRGFGVQGSLVDDAPGAGLRQPCQQEARTVRRPGRSGGPDGQEARRPCAGRAGTGRRGPGGGGMGMPISRASSGT